MLPFLCTCSSHCSAYSVLPCSQGVHRSVLCLRSFCAFILSHSILLPSGQETTGEPKARCRFQEAREPRVRARWTFKNALTVQSYVHLSRNPWELHNTAQGLETQQWHGLALVEASVKWRTEPDLHAGWHGTQSPDPSHLRTPLPLGLARVYSRWSPPRGGQASRGQSRVDFRPNCSFAERKCWVKSPPLASNAITDPGKNYQRMC